MGRIVLDEPLAAELQETAQQENMTVEAWITEAMKRARWEARRKKMREESDWWYSRSLSERAVYEGQFVAVIDKQVIDHDHDEETLHNRIRENYRGKSVLITPAEKMRELR